MLESPPSVRFAMIYVDEAHPVEQNDFPPETGLPQVHLPMTIEQRMENAAVLAGKTSVPVYVDTLDNVGESLYGAHPERLYILHGGRVAMKGGEGPLNYKVTKRLVEGILNQFFQKFASALCRYSQKTAYFYLFYKSLCHSE